MMKPYYECHVTFMAEPKTDGMPGLVYPAVSGWKFSAIDGDPVLGRGVKSYLTRQFRDSMPLPDVIREVEAAATLVRRAGYDVLRTKVEHVVYDSKTLPASLFGE